MPNLAALLTRSAAAHPERVAIKLDDTELSYGLLDAAAARVAGLLQAKGVEPGDRVGIMLPNVPYFPACYYGALRAGATIVPMNVLLKEREVAFYLGDSGAKVLFAWHDFADAAHAGAEEAGAECVLVEPGAFEELLVRCDPADAVAERGGDDTAVILYTSGTTGTPKGAELTHDNLVTNVEVSVELFGADGDAVILGALPFFHAFGQTCALNASIATGARLTLLPRFDAGKALEIMQRDAVTIFEGVPTMYAALLHHPEADAADLSTLDVCASGGAAMPVEVMRAFEERFGCAVLEGYGLSETSPVASFNRRDRERKPGSIGLPIRGVEMKLADVADGVGEIAIRGHNVMKGYWNNPEATAESIRDGWFHTGDLGELDADGFLRITGRKKEIIVTAGGKNVAPALLEDRLRGHPLVSQVLVVGDRKPFIGALVTIDEEAWPDWLSAHGHPAGTAVAALREDTALRTELQAAVDEANTAVSQAEAIKVFRVLPGDFTEANGMLTPSLKVKRSVVATEYAGEIAAIYGP
jgi:long-chain acyl-CoA synthetase